MNKGKGPESASALLGGGTQRIHLQCLGGSSGGFWYKHCGGILKRKVTAQGNGLLGRQISSTVCSSHTNIATIFLPSIQRINNNLEHLRRSVRQ